MNEHHQPKYRVVRADGSPLPDGEPYFVLRGQDRLAAAVLAFYIHKLEENGLTEMARRVTEHLAAFEAWPIQKLPD